MLYEHDVPSGSEIVRVQGCEQGLGTEWPIREREEFSDDLALEKRLVAAAMKPFTEGFFRF